MGIPGWASKFREPKTEIKLIRGTYYKYAVEYKYNPQKKRTDKVTTHILGKITEAGGFSASQMQSLKEQLAAPHNVDIKTYGVFKLFTSLLEDDLQSLGQLFSDGISQLLLTVAMIRWAYQSPIKRMPFLHAHDFCSEQWCSQGIDDKAISATLQYVGENRTVIIDWMKNRLNLNENAINNFIMMDSTHIHTLSRHLKINAPGYNPQHNYDPQVRLMYIFSAQIKQPVYYRLINGNITDLTSMKKCVDELGCADVVFIADKGFYSRQNTTDLKANRLYYIIPVERDNSLVDYTGLEQPGFRKSPDNCFIYMGRVIWCHAYEKNGEKLVTYLDPKLKTKEEYDFLQRTKTHPDKYTETDFAKKLSRFGTLTLTSHLPANLTAAQLYETYKQRNEIEVLFDSYKNVLKADKSYMQNRYVMEGWLMANFIAMIAHYRLYQRLKTNNLLSKYSATDIIELSKAICQAKIRGNWSQVEITKKHRDLFKKIKIDYLI